MLKDFGFASEDTGWNAPPSISTLPFALGTVSSNGPTILGGPLSKKRLNALHASSQCISPSDSTVDGRSAPLLQAIGEFRRARTAPSGSRLPGIRTASGRVDRKSLLSQDVKDVREVNLKHSEKTLRTWSKLNDRSNECLRYEVPLSCASTSVGALSLATSFGLSDNDSFETLPIQQGDSRPYQDRRDSELGATLFLSEAADYLADTNLSNFAAKDAVTKLKIACAASADCEDETSAILAPGFTHRYFKTVNTFGNMIDKVRDLTREVMQLDLQDNILDDDDETEFDFNSTFNSAIVQQKKKDAIVLQERHKLVQLLKECLNKFDTFNWDHLAFDFKRWLQSAELNEAVLREMLEQIAQQERDVLQLLSVSRYLIEESLGMHLLNAARTLTEFHDSMRKHQIEAERRMAPQIPQADDRSASKEMHRAAGIRSKMDLLAEERDRQKRQLEVNRNLYNHVLAATSADEKKNEKVAFDQSKRMSARDVKHKHRTTVVLADQPDGSPGSNKSSPKQSKVLEAKRHSHIENNFTRSLVAGKSAIQKTEAYLEERSQLHERMRKHTRRKAKLQAMDDQRGFVVSDLSHVSYLNAVEEAEVRLLLRRRMELWQQLNKATLPVSLHNFLTREEKEDHDKIPHILINDRLLKDFVNDSIRPEYGEHVTKKYPVITEKRRKGIIASGERLGDVMAALRGMKQESESAASEEKSRLFELQRAKAEARLAEAAKIEEFQSRLTEGDLEFQKAVLESSNLVDQVNREFGCETWDYNVDEMRVCFLRNPRSWIAEALKDGAQEFCEAKVKIAEYNSQVESLRDNLVELHGEFQKERQSRLQAFFDRTSFDDLEWASRLNETLELQIGIFAKWYKKAEAVTVTMPVQQTQEYILSQITDPKVAAQKKTYEEAKVEKAAKGQLAYAESRLTESLVKDLHKYDDMEGRCERLLAARARRHHDETMLGNLVQEIQQVTNSRKHLQLEAMRGSISSSSNMNMSGVRLVGKLMSRVKLAQAAKKVADERKASIMNAAIDASKLGDMEGSQIGAIAAKAGMNSMASKERATIVAGEAHRAALTAISRASFTSHLSNQFDKAEGTASSEGPDSWSIEALARGDVKALLKGRHESDVQIDASLLELNDNEITELMTAAQASSATDIVFNSVVRPSLAEVPPVIETIADENGKKTKRKKKKKGDHDGQETQDQDEKERRVSSLESRRDSARIVAQERERVRAETEKAVMDKKKFENRIVEESAKTKVLEVRRDRRHVDFSRLCKKAARMTGNKEDVKLAAKSIDPDELKEKYQNEMVYIRNQIKTADKMIAFWKKRFALWHAEVRDMYGDDILRELLDDLARQRRKQMSSAERSSIRRNSLVSNASAGQMGRQRVVRQSSVVFQGIIDDNDHWEATKDTRMSKAFSEAFSALNVTNMERSRSILSSGSSDHMMKMSLQRGHALSLDQIEARGIGAMGFRAGGRASLKFGGGFLADERFSQPQLGLGIATFGFGIDKKGRAKREPRRQWQHQVNEVARMRILDFAMDSPVIACSAFGAGFSKGRGRVVRGFTGRAPAGNAGLEDLLVRGPHYGKLKSVHVQSRRSKSKHHLATLPEIPEESPKDKARSKRTRMLAAQARNRASMLQQLHRNSAQERLQALRSRKRDSLVTGTDDRGLITSNVTMLRMFCDDVGEGKDVQQATENASETEQEKAERIAKRLLRKSVVDISWAPMPMGSSNPSSNASDSDSGLSSDEDGVPKYRRPKHPDEEVWCSKNRKTKGVHMLRLCRDAFIQRFGAPDKAYVKLVSPVVGLTAEVFRSIVGTMEFSEEDADIMFEVLLGLCRKPGSARANVHVVKGEAKHPALGGVGRVKNESNDELTMSRQDFCDAMRSIAPVRNLLQLRARIRRKHHNLEHAFRACAGTHDEIAAHAFRDFLATSGVEVKEARNLFKQMIENCSKKMDNMRLDKHAFMSSLVNAEGLTAAHRLRNHFTHVNRKRNDPSAELDSTRRESTSHSRAHSKDPRRRSSNEYVANPSRSQSKDTRRRASNEYSANPSRSQSKVAADNGSRHPSKQASRRPSKERPEPSNLDSQQVSGPPSQEARCRQPSMQQIVDANEDFRSQEARSRQPSMQQIVDANEDFRWQEARSRQPSKQQIVDANGDFRSQEARSRQPSKQQIVDANNDFRPAFSQSLRPPSSSRGRSRSRSPFGGSEYEDTSFRPSRQSSKASYDERQSVHDHLIDLHGPTSLMLRAHSRASSRSCSKPPSRECSPPSRLGCADESSASREHSPTLQNASSRSGFLLPPQLWDRSKKQISRFEQKLRDTSRSRSHSPELLGGTENLDTRGHRSIMRNDNESDPSKDALARELYEDENAYGQATRCVDQHSEVVVAEQQSEALVESKDTQEETSKSNPDRQGAEENVQKTTHLTPSRSSLLISQAASHDAPAPVLQVRRRSSGRVDVAVVKTLMNDTEDPDKKLYNAIMCSLDANCDVTTPIAVEQFQVYAKSLMISAEEAFALFRLTGAGKNDVVTVQDIILRILGGLGHRHHEMRARFGLPLAKNYEQTKSLPGHTQQISLSCNEDQNDFDGFMVGRRRSVEKGNHGEMVEKAVGRSRLALGSPSKSLQRDMNVAKRGFKGNPFNSVASHAKKAKPRTMKKLLKHMPHAFHPSEDSACSEPPSGVEASSEDNMDQKLLPPAKRKLSKSSNSSSSGDEHGTAAQTDGQITSSEGTSPKRHTIAQIRSPNDVSSSRELKKALTLPLHTDEMHPEGHSAKICSLGLGDVDGDVSPKSAANRKRRKSISAAQLLKAKKDTTPKSDSANIGFGLALDLTGNSHVQELPEQEDNAEKSPSKKLFRKATTKMSLARKATKDLALKRKDTTTSFASVGLSIGQELDTGSAWEFTLDEDPAQSPHTLKDDLEALDVPPRNFSEEQIYLKALEIAEAEKHSRRLALFSGDSIELDIATRKLQECRERLISQFKSLPKAFDSLVGTREATTTMKALREKIVRYLKINSLDSERIFSLAETVVDKDGIDFTAFMNLWRFAEPVSSLLNFRKRLVQRYGTIEVAFNILKIQNIDLSIDLLEKPMLAAGIVAKDCDRLFRIMDRVQSGGPRGFLTCSTIRWIVDSGHVLTWLEILQARLGGRGSVKKAFEKLQVHKSIGDHDAPMPTSADLLPVMTCLGFPDEFVPAVFKLLELRDVGDVTIGNLLQVLTIAFDDREGRVLESSSSSVISNGTENGEIGPTEDERNKALTLTIELRRYIIQHFANCQDAFAAFHAKRPDAGINFEEWEAAMIPFGYTDAYSWALIFGHIVEWQHSRWDSKFRSASKGITLDCLASALNRATPVGSLTSLRARLVDVCGSVQQAWTQMAGKDNAEEIGFTQWQQALRQFWVGLADAGKLFALLKATPFTQHNLDHQILLRSSFISGLRSERAIEVHSRMMDLTLLLIRRHGSVSSAFEGQLPSQPLLLNGFEDAVATLLQIQRHDVRPLFAPLIANTGMQKDSLAMVSDFMDVLVDMQAYYLPYRLPQIEETVKRSPQNQRSPRRSSGYHIMSLSPMSKPPDGINTGSTTIPEDESDYNGSSADENRPGTSPLAAKRARHVVSIEAFAEETCDLRPTTAPQEGLGRQKLGQRNAASSSRAVPLPMNFRSLVNERTHNHKEKNAPSQHESTLVLAGGSAFTPRHNQAAERTKSDSPLPEVPANHDHAGRPAAATEKVGLIASGWTKKPASSSELVSLPAIASPRIPEVKEPELKGTLNSSAITSKLFQSAGSPDKRVDLTSHVATSSEEKANLLSHLATHCPGVPNNASLDSTQLVVSGLGGKASESEDPSEFQSLERKKIQPRSSPRTTIMGSSPRTTIVGGAGPGILGGLLSSLQGSAQEKGDAVRGPADVGALNLSGSGLGGGRGRAPTSTPRVPPGLSSITLSATSAAAAILAGHNQK